VLDRHQEVESAGALLTQGGHVIEEVRSPSSPVGDDQVAAHRRLLASAASSPYAHARRCGTLKVRHRFRPFAQAVQWMSSSFSRTA
jgi:hypothetical protein